LKRGYTVRRRSKRRIEIKSGYRREDLRTFSLYGILEKERGRNSDNLAN
jgi:hypothetical protein